MISCRLPNKKTKQNKTEFFCKARIILVIFLSLGCFKWTLPVLAMFRVCLVLT